MNLRTETFSINESSFEIPQSRFIKRLILRYISSILASIFKLSTPVIKHLKRLIYLSLAAGKIKNIPVSVQFDGIIHVVGSADISIDEYSRIGSSVELGTEENGCIEIGQKVRINRGTTIFSYDRIVIGDDTLIGEFVSIRDANHGIRVSKKINTQPHEAKEIIIGNDVWIGRGSVILPGVSIGDGSIIGANSVVTKTIPENVIAVGTPAKVIRTR